MNNIGNLLKLQFNSLLSIKKNLLIILALAIFFTAVQPTMIVFTGAMYLMMATYSITFYEERSKMTELLEAGFIDSFRYLYPNKENVYTWWSYMRQSREKNIGWRIDYFIVSKDIKEKIKEVTIYENILGSDHCPVGLEINFDKM